MKKTKKAETLPQLFIQRVHSNTTQSHLGWIEHDQLKTYGPKEYYDRVKFIAFGLRQLGVKKGDKVSLFAKTSREWHLFDLAILSLGAVVVPIYPSYEGQDLNYIVDHSDTQFLVVENISMLNKVATQDAYKKIKHTIILKNDEDKDLESNQITYEQLYQNSTQNHLEESFDELCYQTNSDDLATIIYTSGTTGAPKGAMISHGAIIAMLDNIYAKLKGHLGPEDRTLTFLPLSHVLGRCDSYLGLRFDLQNIYAESMEKIIENIKIARPTIMIAVPRIFEKIYEGIQARFSKESIAVRTLYSWALAASEKYFNKIEQDRSPLTSEIIQKNLAYKLIFQKIYQNFGGRIRFFVSGGAPLSADIIQFLRHCNLTVLEGYGLTETIAPCVLNPVNKQIPATVGLPLGDVQIKFEQDGEILIKTKALFSGYYKNQEETDKAVQDGWFKTGDIGELNPQGYLKITDRKKDIIITSGGKNIAPQKLEGMLKLDPKISQAIVIGDKRKYLTALIFLEKQGFLDELESMGLERHCTLEEIATHSNTPKLVQSIVDRVNEQLASYERIKKFVVLPMEPSLENGMLTPSLKVKRKTVLSQFQNEIDTMYNKA